MLWRQLLAAGLCLGKTSCKMKLEWSTKMKTVQNLVRYKNGESLCTKCLPFPCNIANPGHRSSRGRSVTCFKRGPIDELQGSRTWGAGRRRRLRRKDKDSIAANAGFPLPLDVIKKDLPMQTQKNSLGCGAPETRHAASSGKMIRHAHVRSGTRNNKYFKPICWLRTECADQYWHMDDVLRSESPASHSELSRVSRVRCERVEDKECRANDSKWTLICPSFNNGLVKCL